MTPKEEMRDFLTTRRARITPEQAGLPVYGANRRVTGLRREEVALLAGISVEYYTRLERGNVGAVSEGVLDGLTHALQLDEAERDHLFRLVQTSATRKPSRRQPTRRRVRPTIQRMLELMPFPAYVRNGRFDVLAANELGRALYSPLYDALGDDPNSARYVFLVPDAHEFFTDFSRIQRDSVAYLRAEAGRDPFSKELTELIGELSTRSETFRQLWAAHDVRHHRAGTKRLHHPLVGDLELDFEAFDLPADEGQRLNVYTAPPDSEAEQALALLASWTARPPTDSTQENRLS
ncbi:helix-turn-helix transcriptional regulator [Aeromicrobium choanae]|uniref:Helix-turn-helix domain-containing protein n=1 Tax=Aeromicrobium choanae TaxID=1736691 RepID=A0A1T4Z4F0_9ACTN|nr:helix-turn-helix transcriptional regulator [Aeromicrobium choanae]SKB08874.1 Helix-turn-helix domain-containing protein [Aeromicrobium choanae]